MASSRLDHPISKLSEQDQLFLLRLGDRLRPIAQAAAVMDTAAEMLCEHLGANRVGYGEILPGGKVVTARDYVKGVDHLPKKFYLDKNAPNVLKHFSEDRTSVASDVLHDPSLTDEQRQGWKFVSVCAHVSVPLKKGGRPVAALAVHQAQPREWTPSEIALIEETAERTWAAVEQARAEEALRNSEARLSAIFTQATVGLSELTLDGRVRRANNAICKLLGRSREELLTMNAADVTHPDDIPRTQRAIAKVIQTGEQAHIDKRYLRPDGQIVYANSSITRLNDEHGKPEAILAVTVDLTARHLTEQALAAELEDNRRLQAISTQLIPSGDVQHLFEELIKVAADIVRADHGVIHLYDPEQQALKLLVAWNVDEALREVSATEACDAGTACAEALRKKHRIIVTDYETDTRFRDSPSAKEYLRVGIRAVQSLPLITRSGRMVGLIATHWNDACEPDERQLWLLDILARQAADLVERHQAEAALLESEERYRTLFNSIDEGFCVMEVLFDAEEKPIDYRYLQVNPAFEKHAGLKNVIGKRQRELVPEHEQYWFDIFGEIAMTGEPRRFIKQARQLGRWYEVYAFRLGDPKNRHVASVLSDVSHRKKEEEELKDADRRKNEFLATLAHELRNPLAPIRAGIDVLRMSEDKRETRHNMLVLMERQMKQMVRLIDDLLDLSRITQGKVQILREQDTLQNILDNAIEGSRPLLNAHDVQLIVSAPPDPVTVSADSARLAQVFSNLLNNAAKYTDAGGRIYLTAELHGQEVVVKVRDTGTGIPADMLQKIFEPFTQLDSASPRSHGGLGVGLSLAKTLVELHGGTISASSEGPGKGSEFVVRLPEIASTARASELATGGFQDEDSVPHSVLVVDDNADAAEALAMMLRMAGDEVQVAHSGIEGLTMAQQLHPELLLLDLGMPELDGYEVARRIRAEPWGKSIVISALTGWGQQEDRQRSEAAGFDYHLVKPIDFNALRNLRKSLPPTTH